MEWLQSLLDNSTMPALTAFLLGLLTALSPCPLATNIAAIGFIGKDIEDRHRIFRNGLLYTLGRVIAYTVLALVLIAILKEGSSLFGIQRFIGKYGEMVLGPAFCPTSGVFYFGMLIPMSATSAAGYLFPVLFAVATALPVLVVAWILAFSAQRIGVVYGRMQVIQKWLNRIVGILFVAIGVYYCIMMYC